MIYQTYQVRQSTEGASSFHFKLDEEPRPRVFREDREDAKACPLTAVVTATSYLPVFVLDLNTIRHPASYKEHPYLKQQLGVRVT